MSSSRICLSVAIAIGACVYAPSFAAAQTVINGRIVFTVCDFNEEGNVQCDIWSMNEDGSDQVNLTNTQNLNEMQPAWSHDGTRIAYVEGSNFVHRLMVMNGDGSEQTVVTPEPSHQFAPTWSPDGTRLAFVREVPGVIFTEQWDIMTVAVDGTDELNLTNSDFDEVDPAWAPDGSKIAFAGVRFEFTVNPITGEPEQAAQWEIVTVNPDGSGEQILTAGEPGSVRATRLEDDRAPSWSPDSSRLVYMTQSVDPCCPPWQIEEILRGGEAIITLSDNPAVNDLAPAYSPDGTLIVFVSDRDAETPGNFDVYTMPVPPRTAASASEELEAADVRRLTTNGRASDPTWGRDPDDAPPPEEFTLTVRVRRSNGAGGRVVSRPRGIACGADCAESYPAGTVVKLVAKPNTQSRFAGWAGACTGKSLTCTVTMEGSRFVRARFVPKL